MLNIQRFLKLLMLSFVALVMLGGVGIAHNGPGSKEYLVQEILRNPHSPLSEDYVRRILNDPRMNQRRPGMTQACRDLVNQDNPNYEQHRLTGTRSLEIGVEFYRANKDIFDKAHRDYGVRPEYILAILRVETYFSHCMGEYRALPQLYYHYVRNHRRSFVIGEIKALLELSVTRQLDPFMESSSMGAFGYAQFMPSSFNPYAVDGNEDGKINLFSAADAVPSIANYLVMNGWARNQNQALWNYNHDRSYVRMLNRYALVVRPLLTARQRTTAQN